MLKFLTFFVLLISLSLHSQCNQYFLYESFTGTLPTQKGTWTATSMVAGTSPVRTGTHQLTFNGVNDAIRTPQIANPGVLTFWHRRSSNSTAWTLNIQTSPNGTTTWTTRGSVSFAGGGGSSTTWTQYSLNIGSLGLTNVFIRLIDGRSSGTNERYVDDLGITSTNASENTLIPFLSACSQNIDSYIYTITDDAGPTAALLGGYTNNVNRTLTFTPSDNTKKLELSFTELDLETDYDYLYVYDGANTSAPLLATLTGETTPSSIIATNAAGQLTIRWTSDISNIGSWGGWVGTIQTITPLPVELLYFEGTPYLTFNRLDWATASEHNSSHFEIEKSLNGFDWDVLGIKTSAGNSNQLIKYSYLDNITNFGIHYYRLKQVDFDGKFKYYSIIAVYNPNKDSKKIIGYYNLNGQKIDIENHQGMYLIIYDDGSIEKSIK